MSSGSDGTKLRIALDTTILVSAIRSKEGAAAILLDLILGSRITLLMSLAIEYEYRDVALRPHHVAVSHLTAMQITNILDQLVALAEPVQIVDSYRPLSVDPDDDLVLDVAINGAADALVTRNLRHFSRAGAEFNIPILEPKTLLDKMRARGKKYGAE